MYTSQRIVHVTMHNKEKQLIKHYSYIGHNVKKIQFWLYMSERVYHLKHINLHVKLESKKLFQE